MTNQEAIKELSEWLDACCGGEEIDPTREALNMAIEALKAQTPCGDAVSRQTLQNELALYPIDDVTSEDEAGYNRAINDVQKMVLHLPSAQPEIIRCNDCKKWHTNCLPLCGKHGCDVISDYTKPDDFCSWAERRTDEQT